MLLKSMLGRAIEKVKLFVIYQLSTNLIAKIFLLFNLHIPAFLEKVQLIKRN